ncbi:MAG: EndoU domain-containing protein [Cellvibrio sp.]|nr:EndoU domain-containing protein [Cellvibrio sp.]
MIPDTLGTMWDGVTAIPGDVYDACSKTTNCFKPDFTMYGTQGQQAYFYKLLGDQETYTDKNAKSIWGGIGTTAEIATLGTGTLVKKGTSETLETVIESVPTNVDDDLFNVTLPPERKAEYVIVDQEIETDFNWSESVDDELFEQKFPTTSEVNLNLNRERPDFYVGPLGPEQTLPATGYRYMRLFNDDGTVNEYALKTLDNDEAPVSFFGFEKYDSGIEAREAFQVRGPEFVTPLDPELSWSDARLRGDFDTLQLYENGEITAFVPKWKGNTDPSKLEPFAEAYPQYGQGGAWQLHADNQVIKFDNVEILPESKLIDNAATDPGKLLNGSSSDQLNFDDIFNANKNTLDSSDTPNFHLDEDLSILDSKAATHILDGDGPSSGGHRYGTGMPGKTEFPQDWNDQKIKNSVSEIATDPNLSWSKPDSRGYIETTKIVDNIEIKVVVDTRKGRIVTAYPTNTPRNPKK